MRFRQGENRLAREPPLKKLAGMTGKGAVSRFWFRCGHVKRDTSGGFLRRGCCGEKIRKSSGRAAPGRNARSRRLRALL